MNIILQLNRNEKSLTSLLLQEILAWNHWRKHQETYDLLDQYLIWRTLGSNVSVERCLEGLICQAVSISWAFLHPRPPKV